MYKDDSNLLYLTFLKPVLREVTRVNLQFQCDHAISDLTKVYQELKSLMMSIAKRFLKSNFLHVNDSINSLCLEDIDRISTALKNPLAILPLDAVDFGYAFSILAEKKTVDHKTLDVVISNCANFLISLCGELVKRLPHNVKCIEKLKHFNLSMLFSILSAKFSDLPLDLTSNFIILIFKLTM